MATRFGWLAVAFVALTLTVSKASADVVIANDDASDVVYDNGWASDGGPYNGGYGFGAWQFGNSSPGNEFIAYGGIHNNPYLNIGSVNINRAFGMWADGGLSAAVRPLSTPLNIGDTFSIKMDNGDVRNDGPGTVGFALQNSANNGTNLAEFYFRGGDSYYTVNAANVVGSTPAFTTLGLQLAFTLTSATSFTLTIDRLENGPGIDNTVTGNLLTNQPITQIRLFNANAGGGSVHDLFFNNLSISAVPEVSPLAAVPLAIAVVAGASGIWRRWKNKRQFAAR